MSWKNYFYFQRRDKVAILILLLLITISGAIFIATKPSPARKDSIETSDLGKKFNEFQAQLSEKETTIKNKQSDKNYIKYPYQEKLKQGETIALNKADTSELKKIPGIGSAYANRIVKYRNLLGGYADISQLKEIWGMDDERYDKITPYITIDRKVKQIQINFATFQELNKHPYVNYEQAKIIVDIRERKGKIESMNRLALLEEFAGNDIERLTPYFDFN